MYKYIYTYIGTSKEVEEKRAKQSRSVSAWIGVPVGAKSSSTITSKDSIQCGLTKVFLRKPAHDMLEGRRSRRMRAAAVMIQSGFKAYIVRRMYLAMIRAIRLIQRVSRGFAARKTAIGVRRFRAAAKIQNGWRTAYAAKRYARFCFALVYLQSAYHGRVARKRVNLLKLVNNIVQLQRFVRGGMVKCWQRRRRRAVVRMQCLVRCGQAKVLWFFII
jgi:myosin heavy subunit